MPERDFPAIESICQAFDYRDGLLYWRERPREHFPAEVDWKIFNTKYPGREAGTMLVSYGSFRRVIRIFNQPYYRYTLVWAIHHGVWRLWLDHKDRDSLNDRIENLRECTNSQNMCNAKLVSSNTSGFKGIFWEESKGKWSARIRANGKRTRLGYFDTPEAAHAAYMRAARELHGEFASDGKPPS